ncbi:MAG: PAS domain S-box protein [Proteobacteria bacterium]|nr:PAS domain S-box protein [Pseudomonadota bacterium]
MTALLAREWELENTKASWRIEKPEARRAPSGTFFPDQNGSAYEALLAQVPVLMHCMDGSGRLLAANAAWCQGLGYEAAEIIGRPFSEFLPKESRSRLVTDIYPKYLLSGSCRGEELLIQRKDGSLATVLLSMTAYRGDRGRLERSVCVLEDVTQQKIAAIATSRGDQRLRNAFAAAVNGMAIVSPKGLIEFANDAFKNFVGRPDIETLMLGVEDLLHKDDRGQFLNGLRQLLAGEVSPLQVELRFMTADNKVVHGAVSVATVKSEKGELEQLIVQAVDITERKTINQRLQKAQKMEAIGQLTGGLAHDFNNLLTIIIGNLQLLDGKLAGDDKAKKRLDEAIDAARKGSELTRQLLAFARKQELEPKDTEINALVKGMEQLVARSLGENVELAVHTMEGEPRSLIDPSQLESAILNLAINARDAMPEGGKLTIETQAAYLDQYYAAKNPEVAPGHYILVAVSDSGTGMSQELLEKVFQPFFTTKANGKGTGLGLSMVYGFIKQSGGHISIYSEIGHGTSVKMYLPRRMQPGERLAAPDTEPVSASLPISAEPVKGAARRPKILVVEDQEAVRAVASGFLEDFGYEVVEAADGFEALSRLQEQQDIELMFSDVVMPGGMNGFDLAQAAQSLNPALKIVHTSGYPKGAMVHQDEPRFREGYIIMKPYRREDLQKIIKDAFERQ